MFQRKPLRDDVQREIRERILDGRLPAESRLNEARLSADLGISRTPLREAMLGLEAAGFLGSALGRGFHVPALAAADFRDTGAMLARLEPHALEISPLPGPQRLMEMQNLLGRAKLKIVGVGGPVTAARLLTGWAGHVFSGCPNRMLQEEIMRCEALNARYWRVAVAAGFPAGEVLSNLEDMYTLIRGKERAAVVAAWPEVMFGMIDRAASLVD
ncbi:MAG: GntR family transcriptional regulator [bacterium]|nr:GntR family transcriptional regulator [bacterium]